MSECDLCYVRQERKNTAREQREVLEHLLSCVVPRKEARHLAKGLREKFQDFQGILDAPYHELSGFNGTGKDVAKLLGLVKASINLYLTQNLTKRKKITNTKALLDYCKVKLNGLREERCMTIFLNSQSEILSIEVIDEGTVDHIVVYPRKVMERALHNKASALIFVHNHPGGNCKPSRDDILLTMKLIQVAQVFQIKVIDHIVISKNDYFSFLERGLL